jgi:uncharacterized membrane protein
MICTHCAAEMPEISMFCPGCGRAIKSREPEMSLPLWETSTLDRLLGALAYVSPIPAILFIAVPALRSSRFVRFHSWQSILFSGGTVVALALLRLIFAFFSILPWVGSLFAWLSVGLVSLAIVVLWAVLTTKAALGEAYELPWLGQFAVRLAD